MLNFIDGLLIGIMITILFIQIRNDIERRQIQKIMIKALAECKEEGIPIEKEGDNE